MQRGVIYARYSPGPNQREESIEGQIRECTEYAEKNGIKVVGAYMDRAASGRSDNRDDFQKMLKDMEKREFEVIIVWKIDRFGRNREEIAVNKIKCKKCGVKVVYAKEHIPEGPTGIILESLLEGLAEYYSAELSEKVIRGLKDNALKGKATNGNVGLGFRIDEDKMIVIDELNAPTVRLVFEMFDEGYKYSDIIAELNNRGLKTLKGGPFNKNSLRKMLKNERYMGLYKWRDIVIENGIPAIVEKERFLRCQERLSRVNRAPGGGKAKVDYLLTGKLFCGLCKANMVGESGTGKSGAKFNYYKCIARKQGSDCKKETVKKAWIERYVAAAIHDIVLTNDEIIDNIATAVMRIQRDSHDGSLLASLEAQYSDVERSIKNLLRLVEKGTVTASTNDRLMELEEAKDDIGARIAAERISKTEITHDHVVFWLTQFRELDLDELESQRKIIDAFVHSVYLYDDKIIITGNYTDKDGVREEITLEDLGLDESGESAKIEGSGGVRISSPSPRHQQCQ